MGTTSTRYFQSFYFSLRGRIGRQAYWVFGILPFFLAGVVLGVLVPALHISARNLMVPLLMLSPILAWMGIAISVKRLHDIGWSGWWTIVCFIPYLDYVMVPILGIIPGKAGANDYGEDPHRPKAQAL
jgi:uncharacterized membrane protein YhaH (DUF805 family)